MVKLACSIPMVYPSLLVHLIVLPIMLWLTLIVSWEMYRFPITETGRPVTAMLSQDFVIEYPLSL